MKYYDRKGDRNGRVDSANEFYDREREREERLNLPLEAVEIDKKKLPVPQMILYKENIRN